MKSKVVEMSNRKKEMLGKVLLKADEADRLDQAAAQAKAALWGYGMDTGMHGHATKPSGWEPIIEVRAEGGSITLSGVQDQKGQWWFSLGRNERTLAMFLDESNHDLLQGQSQVVAGWEEGLKLMDQYQWYDLYPHLVHHEFQKMILAEIIARQPEMDSCNVKEWLAKCSNKEQDDNQFCLVEEKPRRKMAPLVKEYLKSQRPLSVVKLIDLYPLARDQKERESVRTALRRVSVGTTVFENSTPSTCYAIRLCLLNHEEVFLSLPGVPTRELRTEKAEEQYTKEIFKRFAEKYGSETIKFWVQSAQHRSVVQAASGMRNAKKRDSGKCVLCEVEGIQDQKTVSACHVVSRKVLFWEAVEQVEYAKKSIFTDEAVLLLKKKLKSSARHSDKEFIVTLCREHDKLVSSTISKSVGQSDQISTIEPARQAP